MGRSGSASRSSSRPSSKSPSRLSSTSLQTKSRTQTQPQPQPQPQNVYHSHNHSVEKPGFFSNMWQGFGLGAGQSIAFNIFRSNPVTTVNHVHTEVPKEYENCIKESFNDKQKCAEYLKKYEQCMKESNNKESCKDHFKIMY